MISISLFQISHFTTIQIKLFLIYPSRLPFKFYFCFSWPRQGGYLCLAEVKWVKTRVPGVKPLLGVKGWVPLVIHLSHWFVSLFTPISWTNTYLNNGLIIRYSDHGLNKEIFNNWMSLDYLNYRLVRYSGGDCI